MLHTYAFQMSRVSRECNDTSSTTLTMMNNVISLYVRCSWSSWLYQSPPQNDGTQRLIRAQSDGNTNVIISNFPMLGVYSWLPARCKLCTT